jgi:dGTPase
MGRPNRKLYEASDWERAVKNSDGANEPWRSNARKDFARLIYCPSFRRLQGKTQLFPSHESDFFRNRLTHSLEVAQIAKSIAIAINSKHPFFKRDPIDLDLVEFAALAHDIGHPPFGHNGEKILDDLMKDSGGFEGNAQTLRILACIEKKETVQFPSQDSAPIVIDRKTKADQRRGLNLSFRSLASILKYDQKINVTEKARKENGTHEHPCKGYYDLEGAMVDQIRKSLLGPNTSALKTIECSIMDVADDIAYSTYDIEDSFKAGFLSPLSMMSASDDFKQTVADKVIKKTRSIYGNVNASSNFDKSHINEVLADIFYDMLQLPAADVKRIQEAPIEIAEAKFLFSANSYVTSKEIGKNGYIRTQFTSQLVGRFINAVELQFNEDCPKLSNVKLNHETFRIVETLKSYAFQQLIESPMLKLTERRGKEIIDKIFNTLMDEGDLLPDDWKEVYYSLDDSSWRKRVICDYIAGMTDHYCVEIYSRITGHDPVTFWKPH